MRNWMILLPVLLVIGCSETDKPLDTSNRPGEVQEPADWLAELIASLESEPVRNPPALIARYTYQDETVYFVPSYCCDEMSTLYNDDGEIICHPGGGLSGDGDERCSYFFDLATDREVIWKDPRKR